MPMSDKLVDILRPRDWNTFYGQEQIVEYSNRWLKRGTIPDIICVGPPGSGKTTWTLIMISKLFGGVNVWDALHEDILWLNASDERGIDVVRTSIKEFASSLPATDVPFRIVVLEEGDKLTKDAQDALRATTEDYSDTCRFIYLGNDETYIGAIKSRCSILRFIALPDEIMVKHILTACEVVKVDMDEDIAKIVAKYYEGDMRRILNDCLEKLVGIERPVKLTDLDFTSDTRTLAIEIIKIMDDLETKPQDKYFEARKRFTSQHGKLKFDMRNFLKVLQDKLLPDMSFELAEYFSVIDDRLRASSRNKEIHVGALLARMAKDA